MQNAKGRSREGPPVGDGSRRKTPSRRSQKVSGITPPTVERDRQFRHVTDAIMV